MNTYSDIYLQIVFSVKFRGAVIGKDWMPRLHAYIATLINSHGHKSIIVGGVEDHVHILLRYNVNQKIPDLVNKIKHDSTFWVNSQNFIGCKFAWQSGYGVFSYSTSHVDKVKEYIQNQYVHHHVHKISHYDEMRTMLEQRGVQYNPEYLDRELE
jgi:REP element-mobilizing transposase RayT